MKPHRLPHTHTVKLSTGCASLDRLLHGGFPSHTLTELVGESGCGKTQISLQLLLAAQLPNSHGGLAAASLCLHSEFPFPIRRLRQLADYYVPHIPHNPLDRIFIQPVNDAHHLLDILPRLESTIPSSNVKLIVVDSIAALFRGEFDNNAAEMKQRVAMFYKVSSTLRALAWRYGLVVVVVNQVTDVVGDGNLRVGNAAEMWSSGRRVGAALGLSWANCVNMRLFLWREEESVVCGEIEMQNKTRRFMRLIFAPHLPDDWCEFVIGGDGVFGLDRKV